MVAVEAVAEMAAERMVGEVTVELLDLLDNPLQE